MRGLLVAILFAAIATPALAQTAAPGTPEALTNVYQCADIQDNAARLACYDGAVGRLRAAETQGQIVAVDRAQVAEIERDSFGFRLPSLASIVPGFRDEDDDDELTRIETQITRIAARANGRYAFVMANGQTWTQAEAQRISNVRVGDTITVRRGAIGNYMLSPARGGAAHRVRREE